MSCWKQEKNLKLSLGRRIFIFFLGFVDNILFGGAIFGWPQLVYVLKVDGVFSHLCDSTVSSSLELTEFDNETMQTSGEEGRFYLGMDFNNVSRCADIYGSYNSSSGIEEGASRHCAEQDQMFALIHTISVVCYGTPGVFLGFLLHYIGIRITRLAGGLLVSVSFVCLALTTAESSYWLFPAALFLSVGGNAVRMSVMQFGDLFPTHRSTAITVLTGVYAASASVFYLFYIAQETEVPRSIVCAILGSIACVSALCSFFVPPHHIPHEEEENSEESLGESRPQSSISLMETFRSPSSILIMYWFFVILFCVNIYQQFYNVWVTASTCTEEEAGLYSSFYSFSNLITVFCAPVGGMFTDYLVRKAKRKNADDPVIFRTKEIQANFYPLFFTTFFGMTMFACLLFFHPAAVIVSLLCMIIVRPCVVAISTAYIRIRFPANHFNRLLGIYCTFASLMMYFQYPIFQWSQHMYYVANGFVLFLISLSFLNPFHLLCTSYIQKCVKQRDRFLQDGSPVKLIEKPT